MNNKYIINADDYGLTESCSKAIAEAFEKGLITDTTACANGAYIEQAFALAKAKGFLENIGIHINLTEGRPLTDNIANDSFFCENGVFHGRIDRLKKPTKEQLEFLKQEVTAQVQRLLDIGYVISHADSHHHVHTCVYFVDAIQEVLFRFGIKKIRLHRNIGKIPFYKRVVKNWYNKKLRKQGFTTCQYFGSAEDLILWIKKPRKGICEIMVHPDYDAEGVLIDRIEEENGAKFGEPLEKALQSRYESKRTTYKDL